MTRNYMIHLIQIAMVMRIVKDIIWKIVCQEISEWTCENRFKLNNEKTEFIVFTSERQRHKVTSREIGIDGIKVGAADDIMYVVMWLYYSFAMRKHVATVFSKVSRTIALIRKNRKYLFIESSQKLSSGLVMGLLDYGNALYYWLPNKEVT